MEVPNDLFAPDGQLAKARRNKSHQYSAEIPSGLISKPIYKLLTHLPKNYVKRISDLVNDSETELIFLVIRSYAIPYFEPPEMDFYRSMGKVWIIPDSLVQDPKNYFEHTHVNQRGAKRIAKWLAGEVAYLEGKKD